MKKVSVYILLSLSLIGLIACGNEDTAEEKQNGTDNPKTEENAAEQKKLDFDVEVATDDKEIEEKEIKEVKSVTQKIVNDLATGKVDNNFYDEFSDRQINTINDMLQEGTDKEISDEELTEKFLHTYVQLSDKVETFIETNGEIEKVVINQMNKDDLELDGTTQKTMEVDAKLVTKEEELPLNILLDINDGEYEYVHIDSPRT